jgi:hypothetical protein
MNTIAIQIDSLKGELRKASPLKTGYIVFGHRSVGANIMEGIEQINKEIPELGLIITDKEGMPGKDTSIFYHYRNGENSLPFGKVDSFYSTLSKNHQNVNVAFFKFCYVDITHRTDIKKLFAYYKEKMASLEKSYPEIYQIHFTVPLNTKPKGLKGLIKSILKRDNNQKREDFNSMIRKEYPEHNVFDLAKIESAYDSDSYEKSINGTRALRPDLTSDGGHLNEKGKEYIGALLLLKINSILK